MKKLFALLLCVILCCGLFAACSSSSNYAMENKSSTISGDAGEYAATEETSADSEAAPAEEEGGSSGLGNIGNAEIPDTDRKLTYSASFKMETKQYDADYSAITSALSAVGGYVEYEDSSAYSDDGQNTGRHTAFTLRVPIDQYNAFLDDLSGIGTIVSKQKSTEDISDQYYDTDSRIAVLEERKARLMGYLATAETMDDVIKLESEISDVLYELDQLQGSKRKMDSLVDYASVSVTLRELITPETIGSDGQPLAGRASDAFSLSWTGVGEFMQDFAVFWAAAAPILIVAAIFAAIIFAVVKVILLLVRKYRIKHPKKAVPGQQPYFCPPPQDPVHKGSPPQDPQK